MEMTLELIGKGKVDAKFKEFTVKSDQPEMGGGTNTAPAPFEYFLASTALCAGYYVMAFCETRDIPFEDIKIKQQFLRDPNVKFGSTIRIVIELPPDFPEKYRDAVLRSAEACAVKKVIEVQPRFEVVLG